MVSAYAGTADDHGEPPELHASEARRTIAGEDGAVQWDASLLATLDQEVIGATVVTLDRDTFCSRSLWSRRHGATEVPEPRSSSAAAIASAPWVPRSGRSPSRSVTLRNDSMSESGSALTAASADRCFEGSALARGA